MSVCARERVLCLGLCVRMCYCVRNEDSVCVCVHVGVLVAMCGCAFILVCVDLYDWQQICKCVCILFVFW